MICESNIRNMTQSVLFELGCDMLCIGVMGTAWIWVNTGMNEIHGYIFPSIYIYIYYTYRRFVPSQKIFWGSTGLILTMTYHHHVWGKQKQKDFKFTMLKASCTDAVGQPWKFKELGRFAMQWDAWMQCTMLSLARSLSEDHYLASWSKFESQVLLMDKIRRTSALMANIPFQPSELMQDFVHKRVFPCIAWFLAFPRLAAAWFGIVGKQTRLPLPRNDFLKQFDLYLPNWFVLCFGPHFLSLLCCAFRFSHSRSVLAGARSFHKVLTQ